MSSKNGIEKEPVPEVPNEDYKGKLIFASVLACLFMVGLYFARNCLSLEYLVQQEAFLQEYYASQPVLTLALAFLIYVAMTGLSIPGSWILSIAYAWFFGFVPAVILLSFASTLGATIAFWSCRYLLRDFVARHLSNRLKVFKESFEQEGAYYLFLMRLIPLFPFVGINAVMGLTTIRTFTFWWVSQLGMLAGTMMIAFVGSSIPDLSQLQSTGVYSMFTREQMIQFSVACALLVAFPLVTRHLAARFSKLKDQA